MGRAKDIIVKVIPANIANNFVRKVHYSHKVVANSNVHFGAFIDGNLHGVMSFGSSLDKKKIQCLVKNTGWNEFIELNRMAFDDYLPPNSESRCIAIAMKLLKKNAPQIKWVVSFADGAQCGDGTIYRASNFVLTGIKENKTILQFPTGDKIAGMTIEANFDLPVIKKQCDFLGIEHKYRTRTEWIKLGAKYLSGYMLRYIYFIDKSYKERLTVPIIPFSEIDKIGAGMYKGEKVSREERHNKKHPD